MVCESLHTAAMMHPEMALLQMLLCLPSQAADHWQLQTTVPCNTECNDAQKNTHAAYPHTHTHTLSCIQTCVDRVECKTSTTMYCNRGAELGPPSWWSIRLEGGCDIICVYINRYCIIMQENWISNHFTLPRDPCFHQLHSDHVRNLGEANHWLCRLSLLLTWSTLLLCSALAGVLWCGWSQASKLLLAFF